MYIPDKGWDLFYIFQEERERERDRNSTFPQLPVKKWEEKAACPR
jgi:hypothetical protein